MVRKFNKATFILLLIYVFLAIIGLILNALVPVNIEEMTKEECLSCHYREYVDGKCRLKGQQ